MNITSASSPFAVFTKKDLGLEFRVVVTLNILAKLDRTVNGYGNGSKWQFGGDTHLLPPWGFMVDEEGSMERAFAIAGSRVAICANSLDVNSK